MRHTWAEPLSELDSAGLRRQLQLVESAHGVSMTVAGRELVCFASNNYLGLANHPAIKTAVKSAVDQWGIGSGASRLVCGHCLPHRDLEARLATFKGTQAALVFPTGYQANLAAIRGLAGRGDVILLDKLNHASIIDGARGSGATVRVFGHRDYRKLERLLERTASVRQRIIVTDSLFSMDGDLADLPRLVELKQRYDAILCIDEAHATGVFGDGGRGVAELMGVEDQIDVTVGTLSKALGGIGGFIAASAEFIDWLINTAGPFIYTTALPTAACQAALAALDLVDREPQRRRTLLTQAEHLRNILAEQGWDIAGSCSQIVPIVVNDPKRALALSAALEAEHLWVPAIRPPTVPKGRARLRISLSADHTPEDLDRLIATLDRYRMT